MYPSTHPPVFSAIHLIIPSPLLHPLIHHSIHSYFLMSILSQVHPFTNPSLSSPTSYLLFHPPTHSTSHVCIHIPVHLTTPPLVSLGTILPQLYCLSLTPHCGWGRHLQRILPCSTLFALIPQPSEEKQKLLMSYMFVLFNQ